eukprot:6398828-Alexandrium_andersonii.AAC.1
MGAGAYRRSAQTHTCTSARVQTSRALGRPQKRTRTAAITPLLLPPPPVVYRRVLLGSWRGGRSQTL